MDIEIDLDRLADDLGLTTRAFKKHLMDIGLNQVVSDAYRLAGIEAWDDGGGMKLLTYNVEYRHILTAAKDRWNEL